MNVWLREAGADERAELEQVLAEYLIEFDGRDERYPYLDAYWMEAERLAFLIEADGETAGVCLVRIRDGGWSIAEFAVAPAHRGDGIGRAGVERLAELARVAGAGHLEAKIHPNNQQALGFWSAVGFERIPSPTVLTTRRQLA